MKAKKLDLSEYQKKARERTLIEKHTVPITPETKARLRLIKDRIDVNRALRDHLEKILSLAEPV